MDDETALRKPLEAAPCSIRALALEADLSPRLLTMVRDGERRLTAETRDALLAALRRREERYGEARRVLESVDLEARS